MLALATVPAQSLAVINRSRHAWTALQVVVVVVWEDELPLCIIHAPAGRYVCILVLGRPLAALSLLDKVLVELD